AEAPGGRPPTLALAWTVLLGALWLVPGRWLRDESKLLGVGVSHLDKVGHCGLFAVFGLLWARAGRGPRRGAWIVAGGVALAVLTEVGQGLPIVARDPDVLDALADVAGLLPGVAAARRVGASDDRPDRE